MTRRFGFALVAVSLCLLVRPLGSNAGPPAPDFTGTWNGVAKCKGLFFGDKFKGKFVTELDVTQVDNRLGAHVQMTFTSESGFINFGSGMCGRAIVPNDRPTKGMAMLATMGDPSMSFIGSQFKKAQVFEPNAEGVSGKLIGQGPLVSNDTSHFSCSWKMWRTDQVDPGIDPDTICN